MEELNRNSTRSTSLAPTVIANLLRSTILATEIILGSAVLPASLVGTAIAPGSTIEKIEAGLETPGELYETLLRLPIDLANVEKLLQIVESEWTWDKVRTLMDIGHREIRRIASDELDYVRSVSQGLKNFREMSMETLSALVSVLCIYGIAIFLLRVVRLQDRDSLGDRMRKRTWRILSGVPEVEEVCNKIERVYGWKIDPGELATVLQLGIEELNKRRQGTREN